MYIKELTLENFRSAKELRFELDEKINVFVGINGAGKTTILDACAILLAEITRIAKKEDDIHDLFKLTDISNERSSYSRLSLDLSVGAGNIHKLNRSITKFAEENNKITRDLFEFPASLYREIISKKEDINIPVYIYYPVGRAVHDIPLEVQAEHTFTIFDAYTKSLKSRTVFKSFFEWFRLREDLENENIRRAKAFTSDSQLDSVRHALSLFMPQLKDIHVQRNPLGMIAKKNDETINITQLSGGEKILLALIGDLARRLAIANPLRKNPLEGEGIVLIDEIDLHLHPSWQQMIIPKLLETFPHCQFLISTHSPHVLTHIENDSVFLLENTKDGLIYERPRSIYGRTSESILQSFMGLETTRPKEVSDKFNNIYALIHEKELAKAQKIIDELQTAIGDDPELVRGRALIRRMETIGK